MDRDEALTNLLQAIDRVLAAVEEFGHVQEGWGVFKDLENAIKEYRLSGPVPAGVDRAIEEVEDVIKPRRNGGVSD